MAAAVAVADTIGEWWPVIDLLSADFPFEARRILANWMDRPDPRKVLEHEMTKREHQFNTAEENVETLCEHGIERNEAIESEAKYEKFTPKITPKMLHNHMRQKRGSSRRP